MSRILLRDLEPGRLYHIQARATNGEQSSQWSQLWDLQTTSDIMPPAVPSALSWVVEGTAFKAVWTGPTTNQDGSDLRDFKDFQVKIYSPANPGVIATYYTTSARFDLPFELNVNALGTPRAQVVIEVRARDNTGNLSVAATATATNPAPANVTGFTATGITDAISLKWDANPDTDLKYYQVYQGTSAGAENTLVYTGLSNSFVFDTISTNPQYFKIFAVDVFNTQSATAATANATAKSSLAVDVNPPNAPTGVTVTSALDTSDPSGGRVYIDVSWTGVADTDLQNYSVRYSTGTTWEYINVPEGVTTARINGLRPNTNYNVAVAAVDYSGNSSSYTNAGTYPILTAKDTSAPVAPTGVTVGAGVTTMTVYWNENAENDVKGGVGYYEIQLDTANTFNTANLISKQTSGTITSFSNLTSNTAYYTRVRAVDASGNVGAYSSIVSGTPRYIANADIQAGTINGDRITAATINGDRVIANSLDANTIKANTTFSQNLTVGSTFTIGTSGIMKSANYVAGSAGWQLTNNTLEINQGTIRAAALQLQNGHNMLHPAYADFEFVKSWYTSNLITFNDGGVSTWAISDAVDVVGKYNSQCIKTSWTGVGTFSRVYLGPTFTTYNVQLEANTDYIFSGWVYVKTGAGAKTAALGIKLADATFPGPVGNTSIPATSTWTRIWGTFNSGTQTSAELYLSQYTSGDMYWDGLQLEKKVTADTTPSQWKPPGSTSIDGGIIRTGSIQSTASANGLGGQPAWSINMAGNAQLGDANIRGRLVVGDPSNPSADGANSRIHSANYSAGTTGWIIRNDGYAEFRQLAVNSIKVTAFDSPFQNAANAKLFDYMQDATLWLTYGAVTQKTDPGAYSAESLFEFTGPGVVLRNGTGVQRIAYDPTILYRISARIRAYDVATLNANSGFETNLTGWWNYASTTITRDTAKKFAGVASMAMAQAGSSVGVYGAGTTVSVKAGRTYTFSARVLPNTTVARDNLKMNISWLNSGGTEIAVTYNDMAPPVDGSGNPIPIDGTTWVQFSSQGVAPVGAVTANFELQTGQAGVATTGTLAWFDDVTITTPPRVKIGLFGFDNSSNIIDYDFVDQATTPTKIHAMPSDLSLLDDYAPSQYMMVANDEEVQIATGSSSTTSDWITVTGYIKGRGGSGATGKFGTNARAGDPFNPAAFNQEVRYMVPYVEWDIAAGSKAQLDQFSIEAFENGAPAKVDTNGEAATMKSVSIENIQDGTEFDHALRFYSGEIDEKQPGMIGHITDGEMNDAGHLRIVPPLLNRLSDYNSGPYIGIWDQNPNYLYDASFKNGITGWTGMANTTVSHETSVGREDTNALKITAIGTISNPATTELLGKYSVSTLANQELIGQVVTVSGYAMMGTATGRNVRLVVKFMNEAGSMINGYFIEKAVTNTAWTYYAFYTPIPVPDTCYNIEFSFSWFNGATGDIVYVDDVQLEANTDKTDFRSASASRIELNAEVIRSRGPIIIGDTDFSLPTNVIGSTGKPDVGSYRGMIAQSEYGTAGWRMVGYTDSNGTRASNSMAFFGPDGDEQSKVILYGLNDASFPGQVAITSPNGAFTLVTQPAPDGAYPYDVRVYGSLIVDGPLQWQSLTSSAVTPFDSGRALGVAKQNGMLIFRGAGSWSGTAGSSGTVIFTLPVGYRPASPQYMCALMWNGNSWSSGVAFHVKTNGECILWSPPEGAGLGTSLSIEGLHCNMTAMTTITPPGTDTTAPAVPTGFAISAVSSGTSTGSYKLSWTNPSTSDVKGVKIIWRSDRYPTVTIAGSGTKTLTTDGTVVTVAGTASQAKTYTHSGLPVNKTIYYRVVSYDAAGNHSTYVSASRYLLASPITISPSSSGSYRLGYGGMWRNDGDEVYQGDWTGNDNHRGLYFYGSNIYSKLSTGGVVRTPTKVTIYLKRLNTSHGNNAGVGINLRGHLYQSKPSGDPVGGMTNEGSDGDDIVFLSRGEAATVTVPSSWYNNIVDATAANRIEGFGVYGSTTSDYAVLFGKSSGSSYGKLTIYHNG
ncbi:minor tail protein [Streptomyces phage Comrade]|uniref:Minor tail protein n=1 Tax=Streptomyces phage Comrade TaxID=2301714 RepID=A0A385DX75_9CAUD|nr:minor tail protein [Streptomyces phage Comrade]AXQ63317.1 minor tail protein [Streptomyces phage Comrade]